MGEEPQGIIMYTPDGYMPAQLMHLSRPLSSLGGRTAKPLGFPSRASKVDPYRF